MDLTSMLDSTARKFPAKEALVSADGRWTYAELLTASRRAAAVFRDAGVKPGDCIAVMTYNTPGFVFAAFGAWRVGATLVPVNHKMQTPEVAYLAEHANVTLGVVAGELAEIAAPANADITWLTTETAAAGLQSFDALCAAAEPWDGVAVAEDDIAQILYTSGTTSMPKGCVHTHRTIATVAMLTSVAVPLLRTDRFLIAMPIWHSSLLNNWFLSMMFLGGTAVLQREYQPQAFLQTMQDEKISAVFGAPIALLAPLQVVGDLSAYDLSSVRAWIYGASPIGAETARQLMTAYGSDNFFQVYGMTEMGPIGSVLYPEEQISKAGSIGAVGLPGVDIRVVTENGGDAAAGEIGEVWMRADTSMREYLNNAEATAAAYQGNWYRSGDLVRIDDDGYMFIVDRINDVIITGGENVHSKEVEDVLMTHPDITDVAVIGRPQAEWGETVTAVAVLTGDATLDIDTLREWLAPKLARYKIPRALETRSALPRTPSGKVKKHVLRREPANA